jgi:hypothetical protein
MRLLQWIREVLRRFAPAGGNWLPWVGGVLMVLGAGSGMRAWDSTRGLIRTSATVTENTAAFAPRGGVRYVPRVRFRLPGGQLVLALTTGGSDEIEFPAGDSVPVLYPAANPQAARIATVWRLYSTAIVLGVLGIVVLDLGLIFRLIVAKSVH